MKFSKAMKRHASLIVFVTALFSVTCDAADKLVGLHAAMAVSQSLPAIAREAGVFKKNNLDFELVFIQSSGAATAAMLGGDAEIGILGAVGVTRAFLQGAQDFVLVGTIKNILTHSIVARPEIKKPQDLKGKRIGVTRFSSNSHYFAQHALPRYGLDPNRDVIFRQTGGDVAGLAALTNGQVDAMAILTYGPSAIAQGFHYVIFGPDMRIPYAAASFTTRRSVIARRPQVIGAYMRTLAEAAKIFHTDREFTLKVLAKFLRIADRKSLEEAYESEIPAVEPRLDLRPEAIQAVLDEIAPSDGRAKNIKPQQLIDRKYLDEMEKSGFYESLWGKIKG
jgi:NitT/TauT family transport system substrate-binding protein